jgi:diguanylate cyclase (GGDEF)-like protein/PAS domain S-box-containing protein
VDESVQHANSVPGLDRAQLDAITSASADWFALYRVEGPDEFRHEWVDDRSLANAGYAPKDLEGRLVSEVFGAEVNQRVSMRAAEAISTRRPVRYDTTLDLAAGRKSLEVTLSPLYAGDECVQILVSLRDVTDRVQSDAERHASERRLLKLMEHAPDIVWLIDIEGNVQYSTPATKRLLGYSPAELMGASSFVLVDPADLDDMQQFFGRVLAAPPGTPISCELRTRHKNGASLWTECVVTNLLDDPDVGAIVVNAHDITERKKITEQLAYQARHDSLTGLPKREIVLEQVNEMLERARGEHSDAAVLFIDFDGFKLVNDSFGHAAGDLVIREAARRLGDAVGTRGSVARFGGDEFIIVASDLAEVSQHLALADDVRSAIARPFVVKGVSIYLTASVGLATGSADSDCTADLLLRNADTAMYEAKRRKLAGAQLFDESLRHKAERHLETMNDLRTSLSGQQMVLHYQPVFDTATRLLVGVEALVRWNHPTRGLVPPLEFIHIAEETGFIVQLGEWVLNTACEQIAQWARQGLGRQQLSVNVSPRQLADRSVLRKLRAALARSGIDPAMLVLEITENLIMDDPEAAQRILDEVAALGVGIAIDDFGTGYSSFAYLARFPATIVKIDRVFVNLLGCQKGTEQVDAGRARGRADGRILEGERNAALVAGMISMAHSLGLAVVAEGVETESHLAELRRLGCDFSQGFLLGRPMPAAELEALIVGSRNRASAPDLTAPDLTVMLDARVIAERASLT